MKLQLGFIQHDTCPECGARWVKVGLDTSYSGEILRHVNGGEWEYIQYACGRTDKYIPNFERVETQSPCSNNPAVVADKKRKAEVKQKLHAAIGKLNLTEGERERMHRELNAVFGGY